METGEEVTTLEEQKQVAIDYYVNLMRIKANQTSENKELDYQIRVAKIKLSTFSINISGLEYDTHER